METEDEKKTWGAATGVQMKVKFFHDGSLAGDADEQEDLFPPGMRVPGRVGG